MLCVIHGGDGGDAPTCFNVNSRIFSCFTHQCTLRTRILGRQANLILLKDWKNVAHEGCWQPHENAEMLNF